jgi:hypothetical protein
MTILIGRVRAPVVTMLVRSRFLPIIAMLSGLVVVTIVRPVLSTNNRWSASDEHQGQSQWGKS